MPFDSFLIRQLSHRWNSRWSGLEISGVLADKGRIVLQGWQPSTHQKISVLIVLTTGLARIHETQHRFDIPKAAQSVFTRFLPLTVDRVFTPSLDRVLWLQVHWADDWGQTVTGYAVVELTGNLTNFIMLTEDRVILDALRQVPPRNKRRGVLPGTPYAAPPALPDPCGSRLPSDLPPAARPLALLPGWSWEQLCRDLTNYALPFYRLRQESMEDVWVYPLPGWESVEIQDPDAALDEIYWERDRARILANLQSQLAAHWKDRAEHLAKKLGEAEQAAQEDPEAHKEMGDLWLAYQYQFRPGVQKVSVPGFSQPDRHFELELSEGKTPAQMAEACYRAYKKAKHRVSASSRLVTALAQELAEAQRAWQDAGMVHPADYYRKELALLAPRLRHTVQTPQHFRRFASTSGYEILVGRSREENQELTIRRARPDDMWFHVKQSPGSHVVLFSGKDNPSLEDLLDAAHLAVFYSSAKRSSTVAVDYTRRKFVRKRPHAEAGQVLYEREKTLYITPDAQRLRNLGATGDKLTD